MRTLGDTLDTSIYLFTYLFLLQYFSVRVLIDLSCCLPSACLTWLPTPLVFLLCNRGEVFWVARVGLSSSAFRWSGVALFGGMIGFRRYIFIARVAFCYQSFLPLTYFLSIFLYRLGVSLYHDLSTIKLPVGFWFTTAYIGNWFSHPFESWSGHCWPQIAA